jgi:cell division protein ZapA (FtsZ GTPase activity inhibitor)
MADKKNKTSVTIDDKEYFLEDMSEKGRLFQHATDLDRKINNLVFQVEQMQLGRENVMSKLLEEVDLKEDE